MYIYWELDMKAKMFKNANSLVIRLRKTLKLTKDYELNIKQTNSNWDSLFSAVDSFKGEIKRHELMLQDREWQK